MIYAIHQTIFCHEIERERDTASQLVGFCFVFSMLKILLTATNLLFFSTE